MKLTEIRTRKYLKRLRERNIYSARFYDELSKAYSYSLGDRANRDSFYTFEPKQCILRDYLDIEPGQIFSRKFEEIVNKVVFDLLVHGKAYIYLVPTFETKIIEKDKEESVLSSIQLVGLTGFIVKKRNNEITFNTVAYNSVSYNIDLHAAQLIVLDLKEMGYKRNHFSSIVEKLGKTDITISSNKLIKQKIDGYDLSLHRDLNKINELKILKGTGWTFNGQNISSSYALYKRIQENKLKEELLIYVINKVNSGLQEYLANRTCGTIVANIKQKDYRVIWNEYQSGHKNLSEILKIINN